MNNKMKITMCYIILAVSILFLAIGVDYLPHLVCWMPLLISFYFTLNCRAFFVHINRWLDRVIPIE